MTRYDTTFGILLNYVHAGLNVSGIEWSWPVLFHDLCLWPTEGYLVPRIKQMEDY